MNKKLQFVFSGLLLVVLLSFTAHKFYTAIYKIEYNAAKKRVEMTTRIFIDDLNVALSKKYNRKFSLGLATETLEDVDFMNKYISEKIILTLNGKPKSLRFLSKEIDENVLVCYFNCDRVSKIKTFEIANTVLTEVYDEQQNIVQLNFNSKKQTLLLTSETTKGMLK